MSGDGGSVRVLIDRDGDRWIELATDRWWCLPNPAEGVDSIIGPDDVDEPGRSRTDLGPVREVVLTAPSVPSSAESGDEELANIVLDVQKVLRGEVIDRARLTHDDLRNLAIDLHRVELALRTPATPDTPAGRDEAGESASVPDDDERRWDLGDALGMDLEDDIPTWRDLFDGIARLRAMATAPVAAGRDEAEHIDGLAWRMRLYGAFTGHEVIRRGTGFLGAWRAADAPEADRMAAAAAEVVVRALAPTPPAPEVECPSCGATTRARGADRPEDGEPTLTWALARIADLSEQLTRARKPDIVSGAEAAELPKGSRFVVADQDGLPEVLMGVRSGAWSEPPIERERQYVVLHRAPTPVRPLTAGSVVRDAAELDRRATVGTIVEDARGAVGVRVADPVADWHISGFPGGSGALFFPVTVVRPGEQAPAGER